MRAQVEYTEFVEIMTSSLRDLSETKPKKVGPEKATACAMGEVLALEKTCSKHQQTWF